MNPFALIKKVCNRIVRVTKINRVLYRFSRSEVIEFDGKTAESARALLEEHSPNPRTSCICQNRVEPQVDIHIIIPAYNVENYIEECIDSILRISTEKYSYLVTVINDGSTDRTGKILEKYKDCPAVEIVTQENRGFSGARNAGLSHIRGRYVLFVDSDDLIDPRGALKMADVATETGADVVCGAHTRISEGGKASRFVASPTGKFAISKLNGLPWAKLFRAELFADVCFPERYWYEDSIFAQIVFPRISLAVGVAENTYYYRDRATGITNQGVKRPKAIDAYWVNERLLEERAHYGLGMTDEYYEYMLYTVKLTFSRICLQPYEVKKNLFILFCDLFDRNFAGFSARTDEWRELERIVKTRDLGKCIAYAKWM